MVGSVALACGDAGSGRGADASSTGITGPSTDGSEATTGGTESPTSLDDTGGATTTGEASSDGGDNTPKFDMPGFDFADPNTLGCSNDLKRVIDPDSGMVVEVCPPDQGCFDGACIPACDAAANAQGSIGCDYWVPTSPFYANGNPAASQSGPCHALMVANTWDRPAILDLSRSGVDYDVQVVGRIPSGITNAATYDPIPANGIPSGQVALVFLSHRPGVVNGSSLECPVPPAVLQDTAAHGTTQGEAFELHSDTPIQLYDIIPYGGAASYLPSASLIYPHTAWGSSYLAISPHTETGTKWILAVAAEDGTSIDIQPTVAFSAGTIANPPPGQVTNYTLDAGQVLQWSGGSDLAGTILAADKPIGVFTGNTYLRVSTADNPISGQDSAHQQISDVNALSSEYVGAGLVTRLANSGPESVLYRLTGVVDGTQLQWDPAAPNGAPLTLDAGAVVEFETRDLFTVRSQDEDHPFSLTQYMSGTITGKPGCGTDTLNPCMLGDDEWVVLVPPQQYLRYYAFFVDPTYGTSTLVITRIKGPNGYADVELSCLGTVTDWQPVGTEDVYEVAHVVLFRGSTGTDPACETSQHIATSDEGFGITVWGQDHAASYGYPAGGNLKTLNEVDISPEG